MVVAIGKKSGRGWAAHGRAVGPLPIQLYGDRWLTFSPVEGVIPSPSVPGGETYAAPGVVLASSSPPGVSPPVHPCQGAEGVFRALVE